MRKIGLFICVYLLIGWANVASARIRPELRRHAFNGNPVVYAPTQVYITSVLGGYWFLSGMNQDPGYGAVVNTSRSDSTPTISFHVFVDGAQVTHPDRPLYAGETLLFYLGKPGREYRIKAVAYVGHGPFMRVQNIKERTVKPNNDPQDSFVKGITYPVGWVVSFCFYNRPASHHSQHQ